MTYYWQVGFYEYYRTVAKGIGLITADYTWYIPGDNLSGATRTQLLAQVTEVDEEGPLSPINIQIFPNPIHDAASVSVSTRDRQHLRIDLYSLIGAHVATVYDASMTAGAHLIPFSRGTLPAGEYLLQVRAGTASQTRLMILQ
jgi:hypothetical protein